MAEYKEAFAGKTPYIARADGEQETVWIVSKRSPNSTPLGVERVAAYFSESLARDHAAHLVSADGTLIGLEKITVLDRPLRSGE